MMHLLAQWMGLTDPSGAAYLFWSGIGADLGYVSLVAALVRRHNCHVHGCWRWGGKPVSGTSWLVCRRHHAGPRVTAAAVAAVTAPQED
jgi:hypothetical protein